MPHRTLHRIATVTMGAAAVAVSVTALVGHIGLTAVVFVGAIVAGLATIAHLTASPLSVGHTPPRTWFEQPEGGVIVHGARLAATHEPRP